MTGEVINPDGVELVSYGIAFNVKPDDAGSTPKTPSSSIDNNHTGKFSVEITGITTGDNYFVRAFIIYNDGAGKQFTHRHQILFGQSAN